MAERPVFVPLDGRGVVEQVPIRFPWNAGLSDSQKKKNVIALHSAASERGLAPLLEISSKSERLAGKKLSAFNLVTFVDGRETTVECAFQGSKIFENGGPFVELYWAGSQSAKKDPRLKSSGRLRGFVLEGKEYPLSPPTVFYDWLYIKSLYKYFEWAKGLLYFSGFTDIEFNPERSINCQARSCAAFVSLERRGLTGEAMSSFDHFRSLMEAASI